MTESITTHLATAFANRAQLMAQLHAENTDTYRLFHGEVEGRPGLTVDRYGDLLLVQCFHSPLSAEQLAELNHFYAQELPGMSLVYNDRSQANSRIANTLEGEPLALAIQPREAHEMGVTYRIQGRHAGQDPWLFPDLRAVRRRVMQEIPGKSLLNLFAYTCSMGIAAAKVGARFVVNVDSSESSLQIGKENVRHNTLPVRPRFIKSDAFAAMRQFSGLGQAEFVRGKRMPPFPTLKAQQFDCVFLDPPAYAKSAFGVVDLVNDYAAVFKPALLCTQEGGILICTHRVASVSRAVWLDQLQRCATKAGRAIHAFEWIDSDADFPTPDGEASLKVLLLRV
jgi:23S rRNA (cytosine1962-C5)-methyltransferase